MKGKLMSNDDLHSAQAQRFSLKDGGWLSYHHTPARDGTQKKPGVMFLTGFRSDMQGAKAVFLEGWCKERDLSFLRFDYRGHGQSSGRFEDGTIGQWKEDVLAALQRPERIAGLVGVASAPEFTEIMLNQRFDERQRKRLLEEGVVHVPSCDGGDSYPITRALIEDGKNHTLLHAPIAIDCPVRLMHGMADVDVSWQRSIAVAERLTSDNVRVQLLKNGDHRMNTPEGLATLGGLVEEVIALAA
jgi:pimeloyl-ACP methyl ester carboxylesterase